jgi:hypothetical protein
MHRSGIWSAFHQIRSEADASLAFAPCRSRLALEDLPWPGAGTDPVQNAFTVLVQFVRNGYGQVKELVNPGAIAGQ